MDTRRLILRAIVEKLIIGSYSPGDIPESAQLIRELLEEIDDIRYTERRREQTDWSGAALDRADFSRLGNFVVALEEHKDERRVVFTENTHQIVFRFSHLPEHERDRISSYIKRSEHASTAQIESNAQAVIASALSKGKYSPDELMLGSKPTSLRDYVLEGVVHIQKTRRLGIFSARTQIALFTKERTS